MRIESERLRFRFYNKGDLPFLYALVSDPKIVRYIGNGKPKDNSGAETFLNWILDTYERNPNLGLHLLIDKKSNKPIGHAGIVPQTINGVNELEIGYWIARDYWQKGYGTEAALALKDYGKRKLKIERFIALIQPGNIASQKVASKLNMVLEKSIILGGQDVQLYVTT
ncbi:MULTISPECIES: GNAT family N-acetyltransferase [Paraliobacillus]|uniref:GNAT family N-acetyltransferase n=1 Tax=Paraliobacillus TaxID=200903 RepID=UPI000DD3E842|nr:MULTISPECIES: GNAT family N-acetyltransferase [Paraliobacillus]